MDAMITGINDERPSTDAKVRKWGKIRVMGFGAGR
jgi:hypothetical protein